MHSIRMSPRANLRIFHVKGQTNSIYMFRAIVNKRFMTQSVLQKSFPMPCSHFHQTVPGKMSLQKMNGRRCWLVGQVTADEMTDRGCLLNKRLPSGATKVCPWVCRCQTHPKNLIVTQFLQTFKLILIGCPSCRIHNGRLGHGPDIKSTILHFK